MHPDEIRELLRRQPFLPFRLFATDGTSYEVRHPEILIVTRRLVKISLPNSSATPQIAEHKVGIALFHLVRFEQEVPLPSPSTN